MSTSADIQLDDATCKQYETVRADISHDVDSLRMLQKYNPVEDQQKHLLSMAPKLARLLPLLELLFTVGPDSFCETQFTIRSGFHAAFNPNKDASITLPDVYELPCKIAKYIQEERTRRAADGDATGPSNAPAEHAESPPISPLKKRIPRYPSSAAAEHNDNPASSKGAEVTKGVDDMNVDDDGASNTAQVPKGKRAASPTPAKQRRSSKRARLDLSAFNEEAFNASPALELYASAPQIAELMQKAEELLVLPDPNLHKNPLAMRKRLYYIMVEVACIHESVRSTLTRRTQLIDEAAQLTELLAASPAVGSGLEVMVL
ncbi:hypothetical protein C8F01DRAFT_1137379 [Mycena amicta]|nr:hypothetical protein C8F01DRAFT_1137379 [Mycena amicta]